MRKRSAGAIGAAVHTKGLAGDATCHRFDRCAQRRCTPAQWRLEWHSPRLLLHDLYNLAPAVPGLSSLALPRCREPGRGEVVLHLKGVEPCVVPQGMQSCSGCGCASIGSSSTKPRQADVRRRARTARAEAIRCVVRTRAYATDARHQGCAARRRLGPPLRHRFGAQDGDQRSTGSATRRPEAAALHRDGIAPRVSLHRPCAWRDHAERDRHRSSGASESGHLALAALTALCRADASLADLIRAVAATL